jgi:hypothetical protein
MLQDGDLYLMVDKTSTPASLTLRQKVRVPGASWDYEEGDWYRFFKRNKGEVKQTLMQMQKQGINIVNIKKVLDALNAVKL